MHYPTRYIPIVDASILEILREKKAKLFANSGDPDQTPHFAASDLDLHCLPVTRLGVSSLQLVKVSKYLG